ncbi:MAG: UDP-3-O-[3-hydroxymyristoyl] N-acetylglucosamine deacetylase [Phycisphaerales bacterium]|nr:UDP-3-O-[3-hydroxymyristoyl] N-acetylglucosamine deacetylase [Phycisphaerales bacterium]
MSSLPPIAPADIPSTNGFPRHAERTVSLPDERQQHTIGSSTIVRGKGLLLGVDAELEFCPAPAGAGIVFERIDLDPPVTIPGLITNAVSRPRRTTLRVGDATIETVEHCLSAIVGLGIDNLTIRLRGPEIPAGDGSALPFLEPLMLAGRVAQDAKQQIHRITEPIVIEEDDALIAALPSDEPGFRVTYELDYSNVSAPIGRQNRHFNLSRDDYATEIAPARTFSLRSEAESLWAAGLCRHLTPRDALVIGEDGPIENAFRFPDECVRHKVLDVIGDLALCGVRLQGKIVAQRSGHELNRRLARRLFDQVHAAHRSLLIGTGKVLDARAIARIMPHRYPMLLVDRVVEIEGSRRAVGIKNVTINEPFFPGHYPGTPIMPGVMIVEAMAQLGGLLLSQTLEHTGKVAVLLSLDKVKLRKAVTPGDQLVLEAETLRASARSAAVQCRAWVQGKLAAEAQIRFMMVDAEFE